MFHHNDPEDYDCVFQEYVKKFVQRLPEYATKQLGGSWRTVSGFLSDGVVKNHLAGKLYAASRSQWYPSFAILDIDNRDLGTAEKIRSNFGLDEANSLICASESEDSYHVLFAPEYAGKAPTITLLHDVLDEAVERSCIELYPQQTRAVRLPFGLNQRCLDQGKELLDWRALFNCFKKLEPYPIARGRSIAIRNCRSGSSYFSSNPNSLGAYRQGRDLLERGLILPGSRNESQFYVLYYYWRNGLEREVAVDLTKQWIRTRNNNLSREVRNGAWSLIDGEIERQAHSLWAKYNRGQSKRLLSKSSEIGYVTAEDVFRILTNCNCNIAAASFLLRLVLYCSTRQADSNGVPVHSDKLIAFSSRRSYLDHVCRFSAAGILKRDSHYVEGEESKKILLTWNFDRSKPPILLSSVPPQNIREAVALAFPVKEALFVKLHEAGVDSRSISSFRRYLMKKDHSIL